MKIVLSALLALFLVGCSENKQNETQAKEVTVESKSVETVASEVKKDVEVVASEVAEDTKEVVAQAQEKAVDVVTEVKEEAKVVAVEAVKEVEKAVETASKALDTTKKEVEVKTEVAKTPSLDGKALYTSCAACHGQNGEKVALGKSAIIKGWAVDKTVAALNGYIDGTYGHSVMKGTMKAQASKLNADEIKAVSEYISTL